MSKALLVSMIGQGRPKKEGQASYDLIDYQFQDGEVISTRVFGIALYKYLRKKGEDIDLLLVGTNGSSWTELVDVLDVEQQSKHEDLLMSLLKEEEQRNVEENLLEEFVKLIGKSLNTEVKYVLLNSPPSPEEISRKTIRVLFDRFEEKNYNKVYIDITHGFRYMPTVVLLDLMILRKLWNFDIEIYYGFGIYDTGKSEGPKKVARLNHLEDLIKLSEALGILENTGDFRPYYKLISDNQEAQQIYFRIETNAQIGDSKIRELINTPVNFEYVKPIHEKVKNKYLKPLRADRTEDRLKNRARFFFERGQYLKAVLLLYEALILLVGRLKGKIGSSGLEYKEREEVKEYLDQLNYYEWKVLKYLRNACAHGTQPQSQDRSNPDAEAIAEARHAWENEEKFKEVIERSFEFYEKIKNGEIKV
ncbi:TIGR02221 family CRISPR-associated protein [Thermocrinis sp.]|jgi:cell division protein DivIC|uniref:TIGR02221 family CRISPR-associated protein n=1 Tax=Thermocrinis sp. TaxID=2024383 RepID=UPI003C055877